jgi:cardiolipin synthase
MQTLPSLAMTDETTEWWSWVTLVAVGLHFALQVAITVRVVMQRRPTSETMAWVVVVFGLPVFGPLLYLLIGELRLGSKRARRYTELTRPMKQWLAGIPERSIADFSQTDEDFEQYSELGEKTMGVPTLRGNRVTLLDQWHDIFMRLEREIDQAKSTVHLEFYIWHNGGEAAKIVDALIRARERGVVCRVLVDAIGSHRFLRSQAVRRLRTAGVLVQDALPGGLLRMPFVRFDLRLHRKIVVIDGRIAYTGSLNLVDPRYFKRDAGVGQWIDAMVRIEGPAVEALQITFLADWFVETDATLEELRETGDAIPQPRRGDCAVQVMPSGPDLERYAVEHVLLTAVYAAREELILTTPYFLPSEALSLALIAAARRGVKVVLIVPRRIDSKLVRYASAAFKGELLEAGVKIALFNDGLLHTKSITVDGLYCLFGSVNLDPRSFRLNFEILLAMYDRKFTEELRELQQHYLDHSELMDLETFRRRPRLQQAAENVARLAGPLL